MTTKPPIQLNQKQREVLTWIRDGCPDGVYTEGWEHRIIARALERRGLTSIGGRGPTWVATVTSEGHAWLESPPEIAARSEPEPSAADQLLSRVVREGTVAVTAKDRDLKPWHQLIRASMKSSERPRGKQLDIRRVGDWYGTEWEIYLAEYFDDLVTERPVPVPTTVAKYHPLVRAYLKDKDWHYVTDEHVQRAAHILQAIAAEAARRDVQVITREEFNRSKPDHLRSKRAHHLGLRTPAGDYVLDIREMPAPGAKKLERRAYNVRRTLPMWLDGRGWEFTSTGRLELNMHGPGTSYGGAQYRDAKSTTIEDKLSKLFAHFEIEVLRQAHAKRVAEEQAQQRQRRWEAAMADAKVAYAADVRWKHFTALADHRSTLDRHRQFLEAAEHAAERFDDQQRARAGEYLDEMRAQIDASDPLLVPALLVPEVPEPSPEQLQPYLKGWSAHGPER